MGDRSRAPKRLSLDYNCLFLQVLSAAKASEPQRAGEAVVQALLSQKADSRRWPTDEEFSQALLVPNLFHVVTCARLKSMLLGIEHYLHTSKTEPTEMLSHADGRVNIEHLLPQKWEKYWPLEAAPGTDDYDALLERRQHAVHALGNLTITTSKLNPSMSNKAWEAKRKELQKHSLLRITTASVLTLPESVNNMSDHEWSARWDEDRIDRRATWLRDQALSVWPKPA
ncbi:MAG: HNH endonuclease family protein [Chloroflexota bacterium]|nr:HNH endonuclease family protein [Chloroflexota bacterium]